MNSVIAALEEAVEALPAGLRDHVLRVVDEAQRLAGWHSLDEERATIAALGHDLARAFGPEQLLLEAERYRITVSDVERAQPVLLHGPVSARIMADRYGVEDGDVLAAARYHTTARAGMSALERLIFVADKIEPQKARDDEALAEARLLADESIDAALRVILDRQLVRAVERRWPLHPDTLAARNELLAGGR